MKFPNIDFHNGTLINDEPFCQVSMAMLNEADCCKGALTATSLPGMLYKGLVKVIFSCSVFEDFSFLLLGFRWLFDELLKLFCQSFSFSTDFIVLFESLF